ncbi:hypothetical protein IFM89_009229 [Coptis chinensis]|uniref:Uncharacterized protein n=1 Tax=Coptis chinensis TaxID=261450 RepID=A0A835IVH8_9MAGN|nr:hypothetical protein IFM89_009229 [Coptis chinensis]
MMVVKQVAQEHFWNEVNYVIQILEPLYRCLRLLDGDKKPTMSYVQQAFEIIMREKVSKIFGSGWVLDIIDKRWTKQLLHVLHTAAMYLNPKYQYALKLGFSTPHVKAVREVAKVLFSDGHKQAKALHQMISFWDQVGEFGSPVAQAGISISHPAINNSGRGVLNDSSQRRYGPRRGSIGQRRQRGHNRRDDVDINSVSSNFEGMSISSGTHDHDNEMGSVGGYNQSKWILARMNDVQSPWE